MASGYQRDKKDDDSGLGWKFLGAAAIAGAVAAATYGAKKLYDYIEEEKTKSEKEEELKEEKPKWEDPYHKNPLGDSNQAGSSAGIPGNSSKSSLERLLSDPGVSLQNKLLEYHNGYVNIPMHEMERAREVLWRIKKTILKHLQELHPNLITELKDCGSTSEGLKVIRADEFDIMIPLQVAPHAFKIEKENDVPGFCVLRKADPGMYNSLFEYTTEEANGAVYLSPQKLRKKFQSCIQKAINEITQYKIRSGPKGPSITLKVEYDGNKKFDIDFVPVVVLGEAQVVAKPNVEYLKKGNPEYEKYWRESYTLKEWDILSSRRLPESSCHKKCLKIAKAARLNNMAQFGMFSSYVFKTIMLNMIDDTEHSEEWEEEALQERFIDFFNTLLLHLQKGNLPHHFDPFVNLLEEYDDKAIENAKFYLKRIVTNNRFDNLLKTDYSK